MSDIFESDIDDEVENLSALEDNDTDIVGIFDNLELAEQNQKQKQQRNKEHQKETYFTNNFEYWIDTYNINEVDKDM